MKIKHQSPLLQFWSNIEGEPENVGNWQNASEPQDCILVVSDDGEMGVKIMSRDPKPVNEDDSFHVQHVQTAESWIIGLKLYGDG